MNAVHALRFHHSIKTLCRVLKVNTSTYYKHFSSSLSAREIENKKLRAAVLSIYSASKKRLGVYKICTVLNREYGFNVSPGRIYRLMKSMNLPKISTCRIKFSHASNPSSGKNILNRNFSVNTPNTVWVSDITYIRLNSHFAYLCVVIDLFSRKVISYTLSTKINSNLVINAFLSAFNKRNKPQNLIFHSDNGSEYTSMAFRRLIDKCNVIQSFSKKGCPYDNAVAESFFKFLKHEELNRYSFSYLTELKIHVFDYIEGFYNSHRPHSANDMLSPNEKERLFYKDFST